MKITRLLSVLLIVTSCFLTECCSVPTFSESYVPNFTMSPENIKQALIDLQFFDTEDLHELSLAEVMWLVAKIGETRIKQMHRSVYDLILDDDGTCSDDKESFCAILRSSRDTLLRVIYICFLDIPLREKLTHAVLLNAMKKKAIELYALHSRSKKVRRRALKQYEKLARASSFLVHQLSIDLKIVYKDFSVDEQQDYSDCWDFSGRYLALFSQPKKIEYNKTLLNACNAITRECFIGLT